MPFLLGLVCLCVFLPTGFIVVIDMFRKKMALGCLGLILFPIMPFIWVVKWYSGKRKIVAPVLYISAILGISLLTIQWQKASGDLEVFIEEAEKRVGLKCIFNGIKVEEEALLYTLIGIPTKKHEIIYTDVNDMVDQYQKHYIDPMLSDFSELYPEQNEENIAIGIPTPSGFYACYKITHPGTVVKRWHGSEDSLWE